MKIVEGDKLSYRAFVGPENLYDTMSAMQFVRLFQLGLHEDSTLLEVGAGSLRAARLLIPFLLPDMYFAVEPERWLVEQGLENELGHDILDVKRPKFVYNNEFDFAGLHLPEKGVDFCLAQSVFSHTPMSQMSQGLQAISKVLDGVALITYMKGHKDYVGDRWVYPGCVTFTEETLKRTAENCELNIKEMSWVHPSHQTWVVLSKHQKRLDTIVESEEPLVQQYVDNIRQLSERLDRFESLLPIRLARAVQRRAGRRVKKRRT